MIRTDSPTETEMRFFASLAFQQPAKEAFGRTLIATGLNKNIDHVSVLVNGAPEILPLTLDIHEEFIQMPNVTQSALSSPEPSGIFGPELPTPLPDGLAADCDPALCQEVFNISQAQAESVVAPNGMAYDLRWESISAIAGCLRIHQPSLHVSPQLDNTSGSARRRALRKNHSQSVVLRPRGDPRSESSWARASCLMSDIPAGINRAPLAVAQLCYNVFVRQVLFTDDSVRQFRALSQAVKPLIRDAIRLHLIEADPSQTTRNKFRLRRHSEYADFELRAGNWRVFYRVDQHRVIVTLVGEKKGNRLIVEGEEIRL